MNKKRNESLIKLLIDQYAFISDRDDAAMDLGEEFDDELTLNALIKTAINSGEVDLILNSCGESIGKIWVRTNVFSEVVYKSLAKEAQDGVYCVVKNRKPFWVELFHLD